MTRLPRRPFPDRALRLLTRSLVAVFLLTATAPATIARAQGGVAAVLAPADSFDQHIQDTLVAGDFLFCRAFALCARFDTLARRALMVARNAPQIEVSADFSSRLSARIAEERRRRIAEHAPSRAERGPVASRTSSWVRVAAAVVVVAGGTMVARTSTG